jgi:polyether ionophore transport system permease protein
MTHEHRTAPTASYSGLGTMLRIVWRTRRRGILVWTLVLAASMAFTAAAVAGLYDTPAKIQSYADAVTAGNALKAINGHVEGIDSLGGVIQDEFGFMASFLMPLLGISLVAGSTRREEESGRLEALLAGRIGRREPVAAALVVAAAAIAITSLLFALSLVAVGVPGSGSILYAAGLGLLALVFAGLAAVLAQLTLHARGVYTGSLIVLAASYVLRGVGDVTETWWTWLSPLGWQEKTAPFAGQRWWVLLIPLAVTAVLAVAAVRLAERRDLGSALVALGPGPARARTGLRRPLGLAEWIHRPSTLGWLAGGVLLTGMLGALSQQMVDAMEGNPALAEALGTAGDDPLLGLIAVTQLYLAVVATGYVVQAVGVLRGEEAEGRLETRLAGTLSRTRWLVAHSLIVLFGLAVVVGLSTLVMAGGIALSTGDAGDTGDVLSSGLAYLPAELVLAGLALALYGLRPRWFPVAWIGYAAVAFIAFLGPGLNFRDAVMDLAPTTHIGNPPVGSVQPVDVVTLTALALLLGVVGFWAFRRRGVPEA